jgi:isoaspartyl peptidase/L-asparaginase-like protein (Ntn-hydrolase superfamily)
MSELSLGEQGEYPAALAAAYRAGEEVLACAGSALDAVCAAVPHLEDSPLMATAAW